MTCLEYQTYVDVVATADRVFLALANPVRRELLEILTGRPLSAGELSDRFELSRPAVAEHLKVLRDAGLVEVRRDAQRRLYRLRPEPLMELDAWLEPYRAEWAARIDSLERHLQRTAKPVPTTSKGPR